MALRAFLQTIEDFIIPPICPACRNALTASDGRSLCPTCTQKILPLDDKVPRCAVCGGPNDTIVACCRECAEHPKPWFRGVSVFPYDGPGGDLVRDFKYNRHTELAPYLGTMMAHAWQQYGAPAKPQIVVPIPLHWTRLISRGFNQSALLAREIASHLGLEYGELLRRTRRTGHQARLNATQRLQNLRGGFAVRDARRTTNKTILLIDDVYTTGSTLTAAAEALLSAGAAEVSVLTIARA
jgi:ComF family protein